MNYVQLAFCFMATTIIIFSSLINCLEQKLPCVLSQAFRYGKFSAKGRKSKFNIEVPKSWFKHFYVVAFVIYTYVLWLVTTVYILEWTVPKYVLNFLDLVCGTERISQTGKNKIFIAILLMTLQVYRRFYETLRISVFGDKAKINLSHYLVGMFHYPGSALAILSEAALFAETPPHFAEEPFILFHMSLCDKLAIVLFLVAWKHQYTCNKILANLRKNKNGEVVSNNYEVPQGDWFEYLSAPHQTAEIIMYTCIMWILWNNITWFFVFAWVLSNQIETILLTHWWYQEKFEEFPQKRKALIPFLY